MPVFSDRSAAKRAGLSDDDLRRIAQVRVVQRALTVLAFLAVAAFVVLSAQGHRWLAARAFVCFVVLLVVRFIPDMYEPWVRLYRLWRPASAAPAPAPPDARDEAAEARRRL